MKIEQFCQSLKEYLSQFSVVRILMPLAAIILYVCGALYALNALISLGSLVMALAFWLGIVMAVLSWPSASSCPWPSGLPCMPCMN